MAFKQNEITKKFIEDTKTLLNKGDIASYVALAEKLGYNKTSMSNVINGRINIPLPVYKKFADIFNTDTVAHVSNGLSMVSGKVIAIEATQRVILMAVAELLAECREENVTKTLNELEAAVNLQSKSLISKLSRSG